jgi:hypothetical protein
MMPAVKAPRSEKSQHGALKGIRGEIAAQGAGALFEPEDLIKIVTVRKRTDLTRIEAILVTKNVKSTGAAVALTIASKRKISDRRRRNRG